MAPARTGDEELSIEEVERLGARRLAEIVVKHCYRDDGMLQTVRIALAASASGDALVKTPAAEIDAVRREARPECRGLARASVSGSLPPAGRDRASAETGFLAEDGAGGLGVAMMIPPRSFIRSERNSRGHNHLAVAGAFGEREGEKGVGHTLRRRQAAGVFAREGAGAQPGPHDARINQVGAHPR